MPLKCLADLCGPYCFDPTSMISCFLSFFLFYYATSHSHAQEHAASGEVSGNTTEETPRSTLQLQCKCGQVLSRSCSVLSIATPHAQQTEHRALHTLSLPFHTFTNPQGASFQVVALSLGDRDRALSHMSLSSRAFAEATWFPGFAWRIAQCKKCQQHLGWWFERQPILPGAPPTAKVDAPVDAFLGLIDEKARFIFITEAGDARNPMFFVSNVSGQESAGMAF
eukprot:g17212.t1